MKVVRLRLLLFGIFKYSAAQTIKPKFTDKVPFFVDLSVSKKHFTDKPAFPSYLSVKPGPKRLNFYGQTAIFAHFVRNCHFSNRSITDKEPIFIDVSVNGSVFAKCSAR